MRARERGISLNSVLLFRGDFPPRLSRRTQREVLFTSRRLFFRARRVGKTTPGLGEGIALSHSLILQNFCPFDTSEKCRCLKEELISHTFLYIIGVNGRFGWVRCCIPEFDIGSAPVYQNEAGGHCFVAALLLCHLYVKNTKSLSVAIRAEDRQLREPCRLRCPDTSRSS